MHAYLVRRLAQFVPVALLAAIGVWALIYALPGDPAQALAGENATDAQVAAIRERLSLDRPIWEQFISWLGNVLTGDLGESFVSGQSVGALLAERLPATIQLAALSIIVGLVIALPLGMVVALRPRSWPGRLVNVYLATGLAMPTFWLGMLLIIAFSVQLQVLPASSSFVAIWDDPGAALRNVILPAAAIGLHISAITARFVATSLSETMTRDFVRTARAKGALERRVVVRHALRNALLPTVTVVGLQLGALLGGALVVEVVFNYPGIGRMIYSAIGARDYALVQGTVLFVVVAFLVINLIVDVLYAYLDPRIRLG
jgi:peptide/nickel transport system permease protein